MAATTFEATSFKQSAVVGRPISIAHRSREQSFTLDELNDKVKYFKMPIFAKIVGGGIEIAELDSHATPVGELALVVTDGTTTYTLISGFSMGAAAFRDAAVEALTGWKGKVLANQDFWVEVQVTTAPATVAAGNVRVWIEYIRMTEAGEVTE